MLPCEARAFPVGTAYGYMISQPFFTPQKTHMCVNLDHEPYQALSSASMANKTINFAGKYR